MILGIESSCDDTCAAVLTPEGEVLSNVVSSQMQHVRFGGVVPEIASRHHVELINLVVDEALSRAGVQLRDIKLIGATQGPGLVGALLVGFVTGKSLAAALRLPFVAVNHLEGHLASNFLGKNGFEPPFICLLASGGHTLLTHIESHAEHKVIGQTIDDAAGEAFDKGARMLGLPYPGGPELSRLAQQGDRNAFKFPTADRVTGLDFSFSGVKTALLYKIRELGPELAQAQAADLAASYEHAIVEALIKRTKRALEQTGSDRLAIAGGVAANTLLRARVGELGVTVNIPDPEYCVDNAAMIACAALYQAPIEFPNYLDLDVYATSTARARRVVG